MRVFAFVPLALAIALACEGDVHMHDHTPQHGGVVAMSGSHHVEALARRDGELRFWVTDFARVPIPLQGVQGHATVEGDVGAPQDVPLRARNGALEAHAGPLAGEVAEIRFVAVLPGDGDGGETLLIDFTLPLAPP